MQKTAIVTGSTRGIGNAICRQLAGKGFRVVLTGRLLKDAAQAAADISGEVIPAQLDVTDPNSLSAFCDLIRSKFDRLDVLINNAGISGSAPMADFDMGQIRHVLETNILGAMELTKRLMPLLRKSDDARIINMTSEMGTISGLQSGRHAAYRLSKWLMNGFTIMLAAETAESKIRVNAVHPGWVQTDMGGPNAPPSPEAGADTAVWLASAKDIPTGKLFLDREVIDW